MPRKKKKDKIIARLKRQVVQQQTTKIQDHKATRQKVVVKSKIESVAPTLTTHSRPTISPAKRDAASRDNPSLLLVYPTNLIKKDLTKTLALTILAISLELGIYFLLK